MVATFRLSRVTMPLPGRLLVPSVIPEHSLVDKRANVVPVEQGPEEYF
jgi:hypothetical protein